MRPLYPFRLGQTSLRTCCQRESQLLHKYDEHTAHPESFQRISTLSGIHTQVKWQSYFSDNVLQSIYLDENIKNNIILTLN
ncbi:hypothetical protein CI104_02645 [Citrobacter farmeri]|uniref:Uncharacterized protein n=1 Tax=Citrobacter farmeri TaxID=67824 RepID=A0ACA8DDB6_9ENTR|nr:hypothetical protein CI104_02645 [Citrobacter farmeri]